MESIPLGFKRAIVDLINPEKRKRVANGMSRTGFLDLQHGEWWFGRKLSNHFEFGVGECCHHANLNRNWTTSVLLSRDKHSYAKRERDSAKPQSVVFENGEEAIDGRITIPHPKQRFQSPGSTT
jgi:hypothetical protein